jgi:hypothetical protein
VLTNCSLTDNWAETVGGIYNSAGSVTLTNSTLAHNSSFLGAGGIANSGILTLTNCTLAHNTSVISSGGGIANSGTLTLTNCTLTANVAGPFGDGGGGIDTLFGSATLQNTIVALNTSSEVRPLPDDCVGVVTSLGANLIGDPTGCNITLQSSDLMGDPGLGDFTDNGTPGHGHVPLLPGSPAMDAGNDAVCPARDQLGQRRVDIRDVGTSRCDIGAIEFQRRDTQQGDEPLASVAPATP